MGLNINDGQRGAGRKQAPKRVLCVHSGGPVLRGSEYALLDLLATLKRQGHEVRLLCDRPTLRDFARTIGIPTDLVARGELVIDSGETRLQLLGLIASNWRVWRVLRQFKPQVLYCNGGRALQMALAAGRLAGTPIAVHLHSPYPRRYLWMYGVVRADLVIHCSEIVRLKHEDKTKFRRSVTLRNAVDETRFPATAELKRPTAAGAPIVGFIGSLHHRKGVDVLIQAIALLRTRGLECRLRIAGVEENDTYRVLASKAGVAAEFVGEVARGKVSDFFSGIHIHALPSRQDAMPLSIIEAAYAGVPTVATTIGGIPEAMMDGKLGLLYTDNTPDELARVLERMLTSSDWMATAKSREIAELSRNEFSLTANTRRLGALFDSLVPETAA